MAAANSTFELQALCDRFDTVLKEFLATFNQWEKVRVSVDNLLNNRGVT